MHVVGKSGLTACRGDGIRRMQRVLDEFHLTGFPVNLELQKKIISHPIFKKGQFGTGVLAEILKEEKK